MSRPWKSGDVAIVGVAGMTWRAIRADGCWSLESAWSDCLADDLVTSVRPLVVIDPEDREQVARLADAFCLARWSHLDGSNECDPLTRSSMERALREFANPKPPKPAEPTGLGAVVEDERGVRWVRTEPGNGLTNPWQATLHIDEPDDVRNLRWAEVVAVRVLSEGVQS